VLYMPSAPPPAAAAGRNRSSSRVTNGVAAAVMRARGGAAVIGYLDAAVLDATLTARPAAARGGANRGPNPGPAVDFTTMQRVDKPVAPVLAADDAVFDFLFSKTGTPWIAIRQMAADGTPVPSLTLKDVRVTIDVDNTYDVVTADRTENVVGMVEGTDPTLKDTYVFFGAHLDHVGYAKSEGQSNGRVNVPVTDDPIWNGADDDGSGSTAILAIAKAFMTGPKPKRSVVFVWHAGEEAGLLGSQYMADFPVVPLDKIQVELNIDMIGRNRDNDPAQANTVYVIGADRISTDLHNLLVNTDRLLPRPLTLNYEFNDPTDPNSFYTRSDHYSYASKGIPIAFFFTGEHPDYHANTDSVDKIIFPKLVRIAQFIYEAGFSIADSDRVLERDNLGPRSGRGFQGTLPTPPESHR
jgi:Peptidase family M28